MPEYQWVEKNENIAERAFFDFRSFRSGLNNGVLFNFCSKIKLWEIWPLRRVPLRYATIDCTWPFDLNGKVIRSLSGPHW